MFRLETLRSAHELDALKSRWKWLEERCAGTLFQSYEINRRAAQWFAARETPHVVVAESDGGLAIIPAVRRERELGLIGETLFDYRNVLSAGEPELLEQAWRELSRRGLPMEVTALRGPGVRALWGSLQPTEFCNAPMTRRADITAGEFAALHRKARKASSRWAREGFDLIRRESGLRHVAEWVYRHKAEWSGQSDNLFQDRRRQDFMLSMIECCALNCEIWSYENEYGDISAALVTFRYGRCRHFYTIHHDRRWERFSPGHVMIFDVTRESLAEGLDVDFMTGEYPYKNRLATTMVPLFRVAATASQMALWKNGELEKLIPAA